MKLNIFFVLLILFVSSCNSEELKPKSENNENLTTRQENSENSLKAQIREGSHFDFEVGKIINNENVITADINKLKSNWAKFIADNSDLELTYNSIEIIENETGIFLKGIDTDNNATSIIELTIEDGVIYEAYTDTGAGGECTVTCSGCESTGPSSSKECIPHKGDEGYYCTDCSKGTCTKSTTCNDSLEDSILQYEN